MTCTQFFSHMADGLLTVCGFLALSLIIGVPVTIYRDIKYKRPWRM